MAHSILIPTDFTPESLALVRSALNAAREPLDILLVHGIAPAESITGLLFFSKSNLLMKLLKPEFTQALEELKQVYRSGIASCRIELFLGDTQRSFSDFLEANQVAQIFMPGDYRFVKPHRLSKDLLPFLNLSLQEKIKISWSVKRFDTISFSGIKG